MSEYDEYRYDDHPFAETHPDHLATLATLFNLKPAPPTRCRVLELGCGLGGNLVPMALSLPESSFVGVDRSGSQIALGRADAQALGLTNLALHDMDILDVDGRLGCFDYILCHGVFSWVAEDVQAKILAICRSHLLPSGVAYISFNTLPGWHLRGMIRDLLRREVGTSGSPAERVAQGRAFLRFLEQVPARGSPAQAWLKSELDLLAQLSDAYLFYEHLADRCQPMYFEDFAASAGRAGLQYLADAHFHTMLPDRFGEGVAGTVSRMSTSVLETEHYLDLLELRSFRRTLLCRREARVDRTISFERLSGLWVSTALEPASESPDIHAEVTEAFSKPGTAELRTSLPILKAALVLLSRDYPRGLRFEELCTKASALLEREAGSADAELDRERLGSNLLGIFARGQIDLGVRALPYVTVPGPRPLTTALIRLQAGRDQREVTSLRHQSVAVDSFERSLLRQLDGTHTREDLVEMLFHDIQAGEIKVNVDGEPRTEREILVEIIDQELRRLGRSALLVA